MTTEFQEETWTTRDGRILTVAEMDESHVRNVLRLVLRRQRALREKLKPIVELANAELKRRRRERLDFFEKHDIDWVFDEQHWGDS